MSATGKTENAPVVSVVIGAYNAEKLIEETLGSVLDQTLTEPYEVIVVDDGSTDATASIAERFADRDPRVRLIHKENGGSASARNAGAKAARGKFWRFSTRMTAVIEIDYADCFKPFATIRAWASWAHGPVFSMNRECWG